MLRDIKTVLPINDTKEGNQVVSGRDLHTFLEVKTPFWKWIKRMISYGFAENVDFAVTDKNVRDETAFGNHRRLKDYVLTMDMAKEVAMIQRTERGKQARQYFIQVENEYHESVKAPKQMTATSQLRLATKSIVEIDDRVSNLENTMEITTDDQFRLKSMANKVVINALGGKNSNAYRKLSRKVFAQMWRDFKKNFFIPRYGALPKKQLDAGLNYVKSWQPEEVTRYAIQGLNNQTNLGL